MKIPFSYIGGKTVTSKEILRRFGNDRNGVYIEPFFGGGAVLLHNNKPYRREIVCDLAGLIANFWRASKMDPEGVSYWADYPCVHHDLTARNYWLYKWGEENQSRMLNDADYYDVKAAGWYLWGMSYSINNAYGSEFNLRKREGASKSHHSRPQLTRSVGTITANPYDLSRHGDYKMDGKRLNPYMQELSNRLANVKVLCGDWQMALTGASMDRFNYNKGHYEKAFIMLDPPYRVDTGRDARLYKGDNDHDDLSVKVYEWALEHANDDKIKIAYCCAENDFPVPEGWTYITNRFKNYTESKKGTNDLIMFSPQCTVEEVKQLAFF